MLRNHIILAVFKRNLASYFSGVLGYLFIVVFVVAASFLSFTQQFFTNNLANLDQLNAMFPLLLLFLVPAITMGVWADEKKLGTEELLFTLPATDLEIVLAKYLAVLAVYTVALGFSVFQLFVLAWYADPDWGLLLTTYFGYWLSGAALLSAGMLASALTSSTTVAFVLGAAICSIPVFIGESPWLSDLARELSLSEQFREFGMGMIPLNGLLYFIGLTVFMLYLNLVMISKRHWSDAQQANMGLQFLIRTLSLAVTLVSLSLVARASGDVLNLRADMTAENLYTLSPTTKEIIKNIDKKRPVEIQAFLSPEVPRELVAHHKRLIGLLRQYDRLGGGQIEVRFVEVEPFSKHAEEAKHYGIEPRQLQTERGGKYQVADVFLGVVIRSPYDQVVVPFFEIGIPIEYELTRSVRTVSNQQRLTVGILSTDAQVNGGFDRAAFHSLPEWQIIGELKKQYQVEQVALFGDEPIDGDKYDVLMAVLPSSLTEPQLKKLVDYVKTGKPVLIFDDPMPVSIGLQKAPSQPKPRPGGMFGQGGAPPPEPKADGGRATSLLEPLDLTWNNREIVWDTTGKVLHPTFANLIPPELVFISPQSGRQSAFSPNSQVTAGLQELLTFYPGTVRERSDSQLNHEPLLVTGTESSGLINWDELTTQNPFFGISINPDPDRFGDHDPHVIAYHVTSKKKQDGEGINVIYVADVDCISNQIFEIVKNQLHGLQLDNVKFILNAVDILADDTAYVQLRNRRPQHRTLQGIQQQVKKYQDDRSQEEQAAEKEAEKQLELRKKSFQERIDAIDLDPNLTPREKGQKKRIAQEDESRRLKVAEANIEREKDKKVEQIKAEEQRQIRGLERSIMLRAVILPPIPAILLGIVILSLRLATERREIEPGRSVR